MEPRESGSTIFSRKRNGSGNNGKQVKKTRVTCSRKHNTGLYMNESSSRGSSPRVSRSLIATSKESFPCDYCDEIFSNPQALGGHQNGHKEARAITKALKNFNKLNHSSFYPRPSPTKSFPIIPNGNFLRPTMPIFYDPSYHQPRPHMGYLPTNSFPIIPNGNFFRPIMPIFYDPSYHQPNFGPWGTNLFGCNSLIDNPYLSSAISEGGFLSSADEPSEDIPRTNDENYANYRDELELRIGSSNNGPLPYLVGDKHGDVIEQEDPNEIDALVDLTLKL